MIAKKMPGKNKTINDNDFFLPDFCQAQSVFMVILIAELLAVIFTLLNLQPQTSLWNQLGIYSISIQIITLLSVALLCLLRPVLKNYSDWVSGIFSLLVILLSTGLFSLGVIHWYWLTPIDLTNSLQSNLFTRNLFISGLIGTVALRYFYLQQQYRKHLSLEASARLEALQAKIRPHFLFNSMNVIASLTRIDPAKAEAAIEDLSDLFRTTLDNRQELIPFQQELENSERYLAIEKLRLGERLKIVKNIAPQTDNVLVPPLSLQPILENAVYHGIQLIAEGGCVTIDAKIVDKLLIIIISNPKIPQSTHSGSGMALSNISQRLEVIYSGKAQLIRTSTANKYQLEMQIPVSCDYHNH